MISAQTQAFLSVYTRQSVCISQRENPQWGRHRTFTFEWLGKYTGDTVKTDSHAGILGWGLWVYILTSSCLANDATNDTLIHEPQFNTTDIGRKGKNSRLTWNWKCLWILCI